MELSLQGKVALVTGASRGIGKSCALVLSQEGCNLAISARGKQSLYETAEELKSSGWRDGQKHDLVHARQSCLCFVPGWFGLDVEPNVRYSRQI